MVLPEVGGQRGTCLEKRLARGWWPVSVNSALYYILVRYRTLFMERSYASLYASMRLLHQDNRTRSAFATEAC